MLRLPWNGPRAGARDQSLCYRRSATVIEPIAVACLLSLFGILQVHDESGVLHDTPRTPAHRAAVNTSSTTQRRNSQPALLQRRHAQLGTHGVPMSDLTLLILGHGTRRCVTACHSAAACSYLLLQPLQEQLLLLLLRLVLLVAASTGCRVMLGGAHAIHRAAACRRPRAVAFTARRAAVAVGAVRTACWATAAAHAAAALALVPVTARPRPRARPGRGIRPPVRPPTTAPRAAAAAVAPVTASRRAVATRAAAVAAATAVAASAVAVTISTAAATAPPAVAAAAGAASAVPPSVPTSAARPVATTLLAAALAAAV